MEEIKFHNGRNPITQWKKSNFTIKEIQFHNKGNPISQCNKSNLTLEDIQFDIGRNLI